MEKKKFFFYSYEALHIDAAWRVLNEGHDVRYFIKDKQVNDTGDGFVPKVESAKENFEWADVIVFDDALGQGKMADDLRKKGKLVVGGTEYGDQLEDDRSFGQDELKKAGVATLKYQEFTDFDAAIEFVRQHPRRYVVKPSGEAANYKHLLFVGMEEDGSDTVRVLQAYKRVWSKVIKVFQLQNHVSGVEVGVGAFFNGKKFIEPININFEHKRMFPGEHGPPTGEMGTSMFWSKPNRLFNATLKKMESRLIECGYVGYIDINCIVNGQGIYPLEFTSRFGYPIFLIQCDSLNMPLGEFLHNLASGSDFDLKVRKGFDVGVRLLVPPYPYGDKKTFDTYSKNAFVVFKKPNYEGVHLHFVKRVDDTWVVAGNVGSVMTMVGHGTTMKEAQKQVYHRIQNVLIPNLFYRTDIGDRWYEDSDRLHTWGYLREN